MKRRKWWHNTLIWLNAASGGIAFLATAWAALGDALPFPKWVALLIGASVAAINVGLHFVISDPSIIKDIDESR